MNSYYDLMELPHEEAELLVGELVSFPYSTRKNIIISLDEWFTGMFSSKYSVLSVNNIGYRDESRKVELHVMIPGIDDFNFHAWFYESKDINWSSLEDLMFNWAARYNYRNINCHALEDYCRYLGAYYFDWN